MTWVFRHNSQLFWAGVKTEELTSGSAGMKVNIDMKVPLDRPRHVGTDGKVAIEVLPLPVSVITPLHSHTQLCKDKTSKLITRKTWHPIMFRVM